MSRKMQLLNLMLRLRVSHMAGCHISKLFEGKGTILINEHRIMESQSGDPAGSIGGIGRTRVRVCALSEHHNRLACKFRRTHTAHTPRWGQKEGRKALMQA